MFKMWIVLMWYFFFVWLIIILIDIKFDKYIIFICKNLIVCLLRVDISGSLIRK